MTSGGAAPTPRRSTLFHNDGNFTFSRVSGGGITNNLGWFPSAQWADYDNDGFVDRLITQSDSTESGAYTNLLWHNNGNGTFASVIGNPLVTDRMAGWGPLWSDYDGDGFVDAFVMSFANGSNYLYHNTGQGSFTRVTNGVIVTDAYMPSNGSADWGDYDNDGYLDLLVGYLDRNLIYHNNHDGTFTEMKSIAPARDPLPEPSFFFNTTMTMTVFLIST